MNLSLIRKGMILLAVPLLYQLALIGLFGWLQLRDAGGPPHTSPAVARPISTAVLLLGTIASFGLTGALALAFRRAISRRFDVLHENTRRLAEGRELAAPVVGIDEIAELDAAFRRMADELRHADEARRRTIAEIRDLYDNAPCGYHSLDADGRFVDMNETELRWLGYSREEVVGVKRLIDVL
ncbi:MAG: HAMP domain-containing protein, partial [Gemmataceae bacterium]